MPLENAEFIDSLQPDWPTGRDPRSQGDDHIRQLKKVLQNTFPNATGAITGTPEQINNITLNTPWVDNSATLGMSSWFAVYNPKADPGTTPALMAGASATLDDVKNNPSVFMTYQAIANILYPVGSPFISFTDNRNPADILGFGAWEVVTGLIAGVGTAVDSYGYGRDYSAGYQPGYWRVQDGHIVAQQFDVTLAMDAVGDHVHSVPTTHIETSNQNPGAISNGSWDGAGGNAQTGGGGGHTPTGHGVVAIGMGSVTSGAAFHNPYYGCYIWRRTA